MHVEIRPRGNLIRARGGMPIYASLKWEKFYGMLPASSFQGKVIVQRPNYTLLKGPIARMGLFSGLPITVGKGVGILDGGLPHCGFGGVLARGKVEIGDPVYIDGVRIGHVTNIYSGGFARFEVEPFSVKLDNFSMKGHFLLYGLVRRFYVEADPSRRKKDEFKGQSPQSSSARKIKLFLDGFYLLFCGLSREVIHRAQGRFVVEGPVAIRTSRRHEGNAAVREQAQA